MPHCDNPTPPSPASQDSGQLSNLGKKTKPMARASSCGVRWGGEGAYRHLWNPQEEPLEGTRRCRFDWMDSRGYSTYHLTCALFTIYQVNEWPWVIHLEYQNVTTFDQQTSWANVTLMQYTKDSPHKARLHLTNYRYLQVIYVLM